MTTPILATKLYGPPPRPQLVPRPRLTERLSQGLAAGRRLTLISAPAGFGKTTLVSEWVAAGERSTAWLSLDEGDSDPARFLTYLVAAVGTVAEKFGEGVAAVLQAPQPPPTEVVLTALLNEIATLPDPLILVLDDYHVIEAQAVDQTLTFLLEHLPPQLHLVLTTREDPTLPIARLRARGQLTELRATDLRFSAPEAAEFLSQVMGLSLSPADIAALDTRTEGWIAGLQLAALSMQGRPDATSFIRSFSGSHSFVLDFLVEEVLQRQPEAIQRFLLRTSILDRLCGPLCDAVLRDPATSGQATLEYLERANLFIVPLDDERRWYRYHHLFADLLRQRLHQSATSSTVYEGTGVADLHIRASQWYEDHGQAFEAFQHAAAAQDVERAARLIEGEGLPRHSRGVVTTILNWLEALPRSVLDARPSLWWKYASLLLVNGQTTGVEEKLQAAEAALKGSEADDQTRPLIGQIAAVRAVLAMTRYQIETMLKESRRALEHLPPDNLALRANANWTLGVAYQHQGDRAAARRAFTESIALSQACGDTFTTIMSTIGLGDMQVAANELRLAAETFQHVLRLLGEPPLPVACEAHLDLAQIHYEWNDLEAAERHGRLSLHFARQYGPGIDRFVICEVFLAQLKLAQGDVTGAAAMLAEASQSARDHNFVQRVPEVAAVQVLSLLRQGNLAAAAQLAEEHDLPISRARVHLARGNPSAALAVLDPVRQQIEAKGWEDELLKLTVLQALIHQALGDLPAALVPLARALVVAEREGHVRLFVDEGEPMATLLTRMKAEGGRMREYVHKLLAAFGKHDHLQPSSARPAPHSGVIPPPLHEPLSDRELDVLRLLATDLSGPEIARELMVSLSTMRTHTRNIYDKLGVNNRRAAVRRAEELALL